MRFGPAAALRAIDPTVLGARLRTARLARGWTQAELAGGGISIPYMSRIESGARRPNLDVLTDLATRLGTSVEELLLDGDADEQDDLRLALDYAELALESGEAVEAERQARRHLVRAEAARFSDLEARGRYLLARALESLGRIDEAILELERLVDSTTGLMLIRAGIALSRCYREAGDLAMAIAVGPRIEEQIDSAALQATDEGIQLALTVAAAHIERGDLNLAHRICAEAVRRAEELASPSARAGAYWNSSYIMAERGDVQGALPLASRALALLSEGRDVRNLARLRIEVGRLQLRVDPPNIEDALDQLTRAREELAASSASDVDRSRNDVALAQAHLAAGDLDLALEMATAARAAAGDQASQVAAEALVVSGQARAARGEAVAARAAYQEAVHLLTAAGADRSAAQLWVEVADLLEELGDLDAARDAYRNAAASSGVVSRRLRRGATTASAVPVSSRVSPTSR